MVQWQSICLLMQEMQEMWDQSLGWEDPPEKKRATHSSILTWKIPWTEESGGLQSMGLQGVKHNYTTEHNNEFIANLYTESNFFG